MNKIIILLAAFVLFPLNCLAISVPNRNMLCTEYNPDFKHYWKGFPKCNRNVPRWVKTQLYYENGIPECDRGKYTIDHICPLALGCSNHIDNLEPQLRSRSTARLEYQIYLKLRNGELTQQQAIDIILDAKGYL